jgi:hypothetical protein
MALVEKLVRASRERHHVHGSTDCRVSVFTADDGRRYVQLDTFGSRDRKIRGKVSQSLQFGASAARELIAILEREFSGSDR